MNQSTITEIGLQEFCFALAIEAVSFEESVIKGDYLCSVAVTSIDNRMDSLPKSLAFLASIN
jgi:hypothetical protein